MAYNFSNEEQKVILDEPRNDRGEYIRVTSIKKKNSTEVAIDIRNFYTNADNVVCPTQKGLRIPSDLVDKVLGAAITPLCDSDKCKILAQILRELSLDDVINNLEEKGIL